MGRFLIPSIDLVQCRFGVGRRRCRPQCRVLLMGWDGAGYISQRRWRADAVLDAGAAAVTQLQACRLPTELLVSMPTKR